MHIELDAGQNVPSFTHLVETCIYSDNWLAADSRYECILLAAEYSRY